MNFSARPPRKALGLIATVAISLTSPLSLAPIGNAQPSPPGPGPGSTRPPAGSKWKEFKSRAGKFAVSMPTIPQETVKDGTYLFQSSSPDALYILTYSDAQDAATSQQALTVVPEAFAESLKAKIVRSKNISIRNNPGREFEFVLDANNSKGQGRVYAVGKRLYMLVTSSEGQNGQRFFNSFRLI